MAGTTITFNSNSLQTSNVITSDIDHSSTPNKNMPVFDLAHATGGAVPYITYGSKSIMVKGKIIGTSIADCDSRIDTFHGWLTGKDKNLDIGYNGSTRRYVATANTISVKRPVALALPTSRLSLLQPLALV